MADTAGLVLEDLAITRQGTALLRLSAQVAPGQVLSIMGPSGSGKSTLLAALAGTLAPPFAMTGRVLLGGRCVTALPPEARRMGLMFQDALLFAHLSVGENLAFGLPRGGSRSERRQVVERALAEVGLDGFAARDPATLSGGQKTRVALMRMLLADPRALLLDEPFSALDADLCDQMRALVFDRARAVGVPVLLVTHDAADAAAAGGPVVRLG